MADAAPLSGEFASAKAAAQRAYEQALATINARKGKTLQRYGYDTAGKVDPSNPYGSYQMIQRNYADAQGQMSQERDRFGRDMGIKIDGANYSQEGSDGVLQRMGQDRDLSLARLTDARNKSEYAAGFKGRFDNDGNPTGLSLSNDNQHSAFARMLGQQGDQMDAAEDNALARGIGSKGLGAQQAGRVGFQQAGQRQDLRTSLIDMLSDNARGAQDVNRDYTRRSGDVDRSIRDALADMMKSGKDLDFQKGKDEYDMGQQLADALGGLDQERYGAESQLNASNMAALLANVLNQDPTGIAAQAGAGDGTGAAGATAPGAPAGAKKETPAQRAARLRSEALNAKYGLGGSGGGSTYKAM